MRKDTHNAIKADPSKKGKTNL